MPAMHASKLARAEQVKKVAMVGAKIFLRSQGWVLLLLGLLAGCSSTPYTTPANPPPAWPMPESPEMPLPDLPDATLPSSMGIPPGEYAVGDEIALRAIALVGKPYRYGGADLTGFDCSGMVYFIHQALGVEVPRTAADQQRAALRISHAALRPGDLVFFRTTASQRISHVGIYVGDNRFVHAPSSGRLIELRALDDRYYGPRLVGSGRLYPVS